MGSIEMLREMREYGGKPRTTGLDDTTIERFLSGDAALAGAHRVRGFAGAGFGRAPWEPAQSGHETVEKQVGFLISFE